MDLHLAHVPGQLVWIMQDNEPRQLKITSVEISISLDYDENVKTGIRYHLSMGVCGAVSNGENMFDTKKELAEHVFGKM